MSTATSPPAQTPPVAPYKLGSIANLALDAAATQGGKNQGALAKGFVSKTGRAIINVRRDYPWTLTPTYNRTDIPAIFLKEYKQLEGNIKEQLDMFGNVFNNKYSATEAYASPEKIYDKIWQKNGSTTTNFVYVFPYFNDIAYSMGTSPWQKLDDIGPQISDVITGAADIAGDLGAKNVEKLVKGGVKAAQTVNAVADVALKYRYPSVGVADRPKMFAGHTERTITIDFPLFNTIQKDDWKMNLDFIQLFASQNLYNKRDFITGTPPVWYEVEVPGQYFCWAACVTDFTVKNLGNMHSVGQVKEGGYTSGINVPDAYQITITLQEMTQPSKNQYNRVIKAAQNFVQ
jgi:hypothetical protein